MPDTQNLLNCISNLACRGQLRIGALLKTPLHTELRKVLLLQRKEYAQIDAQARHIASARGLTLEAEGSILLYLSCAIVSFRLRYAPKSLSAAAFMIQSCTEGMIGSLQVLHRCSRQCCPVKSLAQLLVDCETSCILQLQGFL